jgi:hypothetical protein
MSEKTPIKKRGRPPKVTETAGGEGSIVATDDGVAVGQVEDEEVICLFDIIWMGIHKVNK